jgi:hypothetical protein
MAGEDEEGVEGGRKKYARRKIRMKAVVDGGDSCVRRLYEVASAPER